MRALILALLPTAAAAQDFTTTTYTCDRGVEIREGGNGGCRWGTEKKSGR